MSQKLYEENNVRDIADAIREQNGTQNSYTVAQMGNAVRAIRTQPDLEALNATENGNYLPSSGKDGFSSVSVSVSGGEAVIQPLNVTQNGTYNPPSGVDGYAPVIVNVYGTQPNVFNWKRYRLLASAYNGGSISFVSDNSFELTNNSGGDVFTVPNGLSGGSRDVEYPSVHGQVFVLRWDVDPDFASTPAQVYIFEDGSTANMSYTEYKFGELRHTVVGSTPRLTFRFGNKAKGVTLKYYNCRLYIEG